MNQRNAVATYNASAQVADEFDFGREQLDLIKQTIMPNATDLELRLFVNLCRSKRLDPLTRQMYAIKQHNGSWQFFASIDGLRVIAERSGKYLGQTAAAWCGPDGVWRDVWLEATAPSAAKVGVWKTGNAEPTWGVATFRSYGQGKKANWLSMPDVMLAKCAEALALRKAFPHDLSGLYVREEYPEPGEDAATPDEPRVVATWTATTAQTPRRDTETVTIDAETGEITHRLPEDAPIYDEIKTARKALGYSPEDVLDIASGLNADLHTQVGAAAVRAHLQGLLPLGERASGEAGVDQWTA